ncbi:amine oxidase [Aspergillus ellipticus CBS 707.79]|uniref:Amine oxidase n=1 Tax=Aspergillus ellipticus CBS 707.79 TaxID=1448320 RepID=A0A319DCU0_9EURO|nr:amine oxidase [Aspergillus ellipticus CBS 707.79]
MPLPSIQALLLLLATFWVQAPSQDTREVIRRDVCIIGGGASGVYTAIRLRQRNYSVVVIEKEGRLGGHTETYLDPDTNTPIGFGVALYQDSPETVDFFTGLGVPVERILPGGGTVQRIDLRTGEAVAPYPGNTSEALARYVAVLQQYPYLATGWSLPDVVPEDLLMTFGELTAKYDLGAAMEVISLYTQGVRYWLDYPAVYILKFMSLALMQALQTGFLQTARHDNSEVYRAALTELGPDAMLHSVVVNSSRAGDAVHQLTVRAADGTSTLIEADTTVLAVAPAGDVLQGLDLDASEASLFGRFIHGHYYAGLVKVANFAPDAQIINRGADTPYGLPDLPCTLMLEAVGVPGLVRVSYASEEPMTALAVQQAVVEDLGRVVGGNGAEAEFVAFADHSPFEMSVSREAIEGGFYQAAGGLQGHRNTFYVGATWEFPGASPIWQAVDRLMPSIVARLGG